MCPWRRQAPHTRSDSSSPGSLLLPLIFVTLLGACGGDPTPPPDPPTPATLTITPASVTFTAIGDSEQFTAQVRDQYGNVMTGVSVTWASLRPTVATADLTTGLVTAAGAGVATITARVSSASGEATVTVAQEVEAMEKTAGDEQEGYFGEPLPVAPAVRLLDANGHPAADIVVTFEVTSGGGTVSPDTVVTRADGLAETIWTPGSEEVQTLTAAAAGLTADFRVTASRLALTIDTDSLRQGRVTLSYNEALRARGGSTEGYVWSLPEGSRLPAGLELSPDGTIRGTPLEADTADFTVRVADSEGGEAFAALGMRVCEGPLGLRARRRSRGELDRYQDVRPLRACTGRLGVLPRHAGRARPVGWAAPQRRSSGRGGSAGRDSGSAPGRGGPGRDEGTGTAPRSGGGLGPRAGDRGRERRASPADPPTGGRTHGAAGRRGTADGHAPAGGSDASGAAPDRGGQPDAEDVPPLQPRRRSRPLRRRQDGGRRHHRRERPHGRLRGRDRRVARPGGQREPHHRLLFGPWRGGHRTLLRWRERRQRGRKDRRSGGPGADRRTRLRVVRRHDLDRT